MSDADTEDVQRQQLLKGVTISFLGLTWITVSLRCYVRVRLADGCDLSDYLMLLSLLGFAVLGGFTLTSVYYGFGIQKQYLAPSDHLQAAKYLTLATIVWPLDMLFIKLSVAFLLLRIAVQRRYMWVLKFSMSFVSIWTIVQFLFLLLRCRPMQALWDLSYVGGYCVPAIYLPRFVVAFSVLCILSDFLYAVLPIPMLLTTRMKKQAKFAVLVILGLGVFASIATMMRLQTLSGIVGPDGQLLLYKCTEGMTWTIVEPGISITAASLITLRPLLRSWGVTAFNSSDVPPTPRLNSFHPAVSAEGKPPAGSSTPKKTTTSGMFLNAITASLAPAEDEIVSNMEAQPDPAKKEGEGDNTPATERKPVRARSVATRLRTKQPEQETSDR